MATQDMAAKKAQAIELLAHGDITQKEVAKVLNINENTITNWKKNTDFIDQLVQRSRQVIKAQLPEIYRALGKAAKKGRSAHIKIMLDHIEKVEKMAHNQQSITFTWNSTDDEE